ncbi:MAG: nitroreductase family protein [Blautia sp.]
MEAMQAILTRKSVRTYTGQVVVTDQQVEQLIEAGMRAPSGLANEPWRFAIIRDKAVKSNLARLTKHTKVLEGADVLLVCSWTMRWVTMW